jgi:zinc transporter ZupT
MLTVLAVGLLVCTHLVIGRLHFLKGTPRSVWLSIAGGVSVAFVFVHLLPRLGEAQKSLDDEVPLEMLALEHLAHLTALIGFVSFYGLERAAKISRRRHSRDGADGGHNHGIFWLHVSAFAAYNMLIGYLLHHRGETTLALFTFAVALHFAVANFGLREQYPRHYDRIGRWILAGAVIGGWIIGLTMRIPEGAQAILLAVLAGCMILIVMKEELPEERESRYWAFVTGAGVYSALLLLL